VTLSKTVAQVHKVDKQLMQSKEEHEMEIRGIQNQAEQIKAEVSELKNATVHSIAHSSGRVHVLQANSLSTTSLHSPPPLLPPPLSQAASAL